MKDEDKTKKQLINELIKMRQQIAELEKVETKSKRVKEALKVNEKKYRFLYKNSPAINIIIGIDGLIKDINKSVVENLGYSRDEVISKHVIDFVVPELRKKVTTKLARAFKGEYTPTIDIDVYAKDKSIHTLLFSPGRVLLYKGDQPTSVLFTAIDITKRLSAERVGKRAEEALQKSERLFRTIFETAHDSIFVKDRALKYTQVNPAMERLFGLPASKLIGQTDENLFGEEAGAYLRDIDSRVISGESIEDVHTKPVEGIPKTFYVIKVPIRDKTGKITGLCGIARDITERKWIEEELIESEQRYRDIVEKSGIAVSLDDEKGNIKYVNKKFAELFGYSAKEMRTKSINTFVHPDDVERVMKFHNQRIRGEQAPSRYEFRGVKKDGSTIYLEVDVVEVRMGEKITGTRSYIWDITQRKRAEAHKAAALDVLRESEEKYRTIFENVNDHIIYLNKYGTIISANDREDTYGRKLEEIVGKHFTKLGFFDAKNIPKTLKLFKDVITGRRTIKTLEMEVKHKDGHKIPVEVSTNIIKKNGKIEGFLCLVRDITERKRAEEALQESEERYRSLVESSEDPIYLIDRNLCYTFANKKFLTRLGKLPDEVLGKGYIEFHSPERTEEFSKTVEKVFQTGNSVFYEHESQRDGRFFLRTLSPVMDSQTGTVESVTVISKDITERKRAEEEAHKMHQGLVEAHEKLQRAYEEEKQLRDKLIQSEKLASLGQMGAKISHEINNPLTVIRGRAQIFLTKNISEELRKVFTLIELESMRIKNITSTYMNLSKPAPSKREKVNLNEVVEETVESLIITGEIKYYKIYKNLHSDLPEVIGDRDRFIQVFRNLIVNASHAMADSEEKILTFQSSVSKDGKFAEVSIHDTGSGIEKENLDKIFEIYYTTKAGKLGTGLGLVVVKDIVEKQYKGKVLVESEVGKGTTFTVQLPLKIERKRKRILIVDDEAYTREIFVAFLEKCGMEVFEACNGREALENFEKVQLDIVLADIVLPIMDGFELVEEIRSRKPEQKIILMTGFYYEPKIKEKLERYNIPFFTKPADLDAIWKMIQKELGKQKSI